MGTEGTDKGHTEAMGTLQWPGAQLWGSWLWGTADEGGTERGAGSGEAACMGGTVQISLKSSHGGGGHPTPGELLTP